MQKQYDQTKMVGSVYSDLLGSVCSGQLGSISTGQVGSISAEFPACRTKADSSFTLPFFLDKDNHYSITTIYNGRNKKEDCPFQTKNYSLALSPEATQRSVNVIFQNQLTSFKEMNLKEKYTKYWRFYEDVILDVNYAD